MRKQKTLKDVQLTYDSNLRHVPLNILYRRSDKNGVIYLKKSEAKALYLLLKEVFGGSDE